MEETRKGIDWSSLWKKEDWLAVWVGFLIIAVVIGGAFAKMPKFKWTMEGEFSSFTAKTAPAVEKLAGSADEKGETAVRDQAIALRAALETGDRKAIGEAGKKLEDISKESKDEGIKKKAGLIGKEVKGQAGNLSGKVFSGENITKAVAIGFAYLAITILALMLLGEKAGRIVIGFPVVFVLAWLAQFIAGNYTVSYYGVEYVLWCLFLGLFISNVIGVPEWLKPAVRTEFYIKTGVVILGSGIFFKEIVKAGAYGIAQAVIVVMVVWYVCFWIARKLKVDDEFAAMLSSAVAICGVSAAIATAGAIKGNPKKLSYVTSIVLICAIPMLLLQPVIAKAIGMPEVVAGAWLGGTLDTSGSVVAAGELISETAMKTGVIVKMSQNVLIGVAAFVLAIVWTFRKNPNLAPGEKPGAAEIWYRFPKFVMGFIVASILFSFIMSPEVISATKGSLGGLRTWWFALAFTCIGLETRFGELAKLGGGRPALAFVLAQGINIFLTLGLAYLIFGGILFSAPKI